MRGFVKKLTAAAGLVMLIAAPFATLVLSPNTYAADPPTKPEDCEYRILGMPTWFRGLVKVEDSQCVISSPDEMNSAPAGEPSNGLANFIWRVALNVIEMALFIVGFIALFFIIYGGFQFLTGGSNPGQIEKARTTILNAVIGLAIAMASIGVVNLIFRIING